MDVQPIAPTLANGEAAPQADVSALRALAQSQQNAALQNLSFQQQSLQIAVRGANQLAMFGGDGSFALRQASNAMAAADQDIKILRNGVGANSPSTLNSLARIVRGFSLLAQSLITSPSIPRGQKGPFGPQRDIASIRGSINHMASTLGGSSLSIMV